MARNAAGFRQERRRGAPYLPLAALSLRRAREGPFLATFLILIFHQRKCYNVPVRSSAVSR